MMKLFWATFLLSFFTLHNVFAQAGKARQVRPQTKVSASASRGPASDPNAPIEVRGQSRNLNMLLTLKNEKEAIDFIKLRKDYQKEVQEMQY